MFTWFTYKVHECQIGVRYFCFCLPIKTAKLNLSSTCNYRAIALSSIFSKILDKIIMSLQSEYLITSELQFGFKEHSSTIMCSTLLVETVEYYVSNNSSVYVLLIDASKVFDRLCHSKLFDVLDTYNGWLQTTQPTSGGAVTVDSSCCANCVEPPRPQQWGPDLPFFGHAGHADPLDCWRCCSQKRVMSRPIQYTDTWTCHLHR